MTFNIKDFPEKYLDTYNIEIIHPDDFIFYQIELAPGKACSAIRDQRNALKNPPKNTEEFLAILQKQQLPQTVSVLKKYVDLI